MCRMSHQPAPVWSVPISKCVECHISLPLYGLFQSHSVSNVTSACHCMVCSNLTVCRMSHQPAPVWSVPISKCVECHISLPLYGLFQSHSVSNVTSACPCMVCSNLTVCRMSHQPVTVWSVPISKCVECHISLSLYGLFQSHSVSNVTSACPCMVCSNLTVCRMSHQPAPVWSVPISQCVECHISLSLYGLFQSHSVSNVTSACPCMVCSNLTVCRMSHQPAPVWSVPISQCVECHISLSLYGLFQSHSVSNVTSACPCMVCSNLTVCRMSHQPAPVWSVPISQCVVCHISLPLYGLFQSHSVSNVTSACPCMVCSNLTVCRMSHQPAPVWSVPISKCVECHISLPLYGLFQSHSVSNVTSACHCMVCSNLTVCRMSHQPVTVWSVPISQCVECHISLPLYGLFQSHSLSNVTSACPCMVCSNLTVCRMSHQPVPVWSVPISQCVECHISLPLYDLFQSHSVSNVTSACPCMVCSNLTVCRMSHQPAPVWSVPISQCVECHISLPLYGLFQSHSVSNVTSACPCMVCSNLTVCRMSHQPAPVWSVPISKCVECHISLSLYGLFQSHSVSNVTSACPCMVCSNLTVCRMSHQPAPVWSVPISQCVECHISLPLYGLFQSHSVSNVTSACPCMVCSNLKVCRMSHQPVTVWSVPISQCVECHISLPLYGLFQSQSVSNVTSACPCMVCSNLKVCRMSHQPAPVWSVPISQCVECHISLPLYGLFQSHSVSNVTSACHCMVCSNLKVCRMSHQPAPVWSVPISKCVECHISLPLYDLFQSHSVSNVTSACPCMVCSNLTVCRMSHQPAPVWSVPISQCVECHISLSLYGLFQSQSVSNVTSACPCMVCSNLKVRSNVTSACHFMICFKLSLTPLKRNGMDLTSSQLNQTIVFVSQRAKHTTCTS